ncbi:MAG: hypothetical protein L0196_09115 [candidate division Zixibacteria bacterium]|nr:hypothetical protein [candidate division Zixibacteria bacterium]
MGKKRATKRKFVLKQNRRRREKYQKLKAKYAAAKTDEERKKILEKLARLAPFVGVEKWVEKSPTGQSKGAARG